MDPSFGGSDRLDAWRRYGWKFRLRLGLQERRHARVQILFRWPAILLRLRDFMAVHRHGVTTTGEACPISGQVGGAVLQFEIDNGRGNSGPVTPTILHR